MIAKRAAAGRMVRFGRKTTDGTTSPTAYRLDGTPSASAEVEETVNVAAPGAREFIRLKKVEAEFAHDGNGTADDLSEVELFYSYRFGAAAYGATTSIQKHRHSSGLGVDCGASDWAVSQAHIPTGSVELSTDGPVGESLDVQFHLRKNTSGLGTVTAYAIKNAKVTYDILRRSVHGRVVA